MLMLLSAFAGCSKKEEPNANPTGTEAPGTDNQTNSGDGPSESEKGTSNGNGSENGTEKGTDNGNGNVTDSDPEIETERDTTPKLENYANGELIEYADYMSNNVNVYYTDGDRSGYEISNLNMIYTYNLKKSTGDTIGTLKNKKGGVYLEQTMDVFVKMSNGKTYYSSKSTSDARGNSFRNGLYYYDVRILDHDFVNNITIVDSQDFVMVNDDSTFRKKEMNGNVKDNAFIGVITGVVDPQVRWDHIEYDTSKFNAVSLTVTTTQSSQMELFFVAGDPEKHPDGAYSEEQKVRFSVIPDGTPHTYIIPLDGEGIADFYGTMRSLRFDFNGYQGEKVTISDVKLVKRDYDEAPALYLDRTLHTYPDKLHQVAHVVAGKDTEGIVEIGMVTNIPADRVAKIVVKDAKGQYSDLNGVDWATAEYIGFDIKDVGIFGYIMPYDNQSGTMTVTLKDGVYTIIQTKTPEDGAIYAPVNNTSNDFYMGQRLYTDTNHDFDAFLLEAYIERNPLTSENIVVDEEMSSATAKFNGYEALRGCYKFTLPPNVSFQDSYDNRFNEHNNVVFTVTGDSVDRSLYVLAYAYTTDLECSVVLNADEMLLPIPVQSCKNFKHEHEEPKFDKGDVRYGEAYFPMIVRKGESTKLKVIHLYQNWGANPLKQISSIQCFVPYYHLSTGVTETNCITFQYVYGKDLFTLPDHRAMSAPIWDSEPQHTSGGYHHFLQYTDSEGNYSASENTINSVMSYGPTYAEVKMDFISDDGRIKVTYTHMEMPQTDENRAYYEMHYEVLEDISFDNFATDFSFYKASAYQGTYKYVGYLDENNNPQIREVNDKADQPAVYTLGDQCPYFDSFMMDSGSYLDHPNGWVNLSCLVYNYELTIGGEKSDARLALVDVNQGSSLSIDLEKVTLKKGDEFTINMLIVPWGSHKMAYEDADGNVLPDADSNVRRIRENSLLNPIVATPVEMCELVEDTYIPMVKSTDGKSAIFKISGGADNVVDGTYNTVVRVYGFNSLTVPRIMEKIDGKWETYRVNSAMTPDVLANRHPYDGYGVHYDSDGTFSYSFVVDMSKGEEREFRVVAGGRFTGWTDEDRYPKLENVVEPSEDMLPVYFDPVEINTNAIIGSSNQMLMQNDEDGSYIRIFGNGSAKEAYVTMLPPASEQSAGQYIVIRYRVPETSPVSGANWFLEVFSSTTGNEPGLTNYAHRPSGIITDGRWHIMVFDMTAFTTSKEYLPDANGNYFPKFIRFDLYNSPVDVAWDEKTYIDIAYVGISGDLSEIYELNSDIVDENGKELPDPNAVPDPLPLYFDVNDIGAGSLVGFGGNEIIKEGDQEFIRLYGDGTSPESRLTVANSFGNATGQYVVIKYRISADEAEWFSNKLFDIFCSTVNTGANGDNVTYFGNIKADGEWHIIAVDMSKFESNKEFFAEDGVYTANFISFDCFNGTAPTTTYIDIEYIGMTGDLADVESLASELGQYTLIENNIDANQQVIEVAAKSE